MIKESKQSPNKLHISRLYIQTIHFYFLIIMIRLRCSFDQKLELCLTVVSVLLNIRFGNARISVPKIGMLMCKTACITPCIFLAQDFVYSNELVGEIVFHIFKLKK